MVGVTSLYTQNLAGAILSGIGYCGKNGYRGQSCPKRSSAHTRCISSSLRSILTITIDTASSDEAGFFLAIAAFAYLALACFRMERSGSACSTRGGGSHSEIFQHDRVDFVPSQSKRQVPSIPGWVRIKNPCRTDWPAEYRFRLAIETDGGNLERIPNGAGDINMLIVRGPGG